MGTYNYSGMYYKDGRFSFSGINHFLWDMLPYYRLGNASRDDLPGEGEKLSDNKGRYEDDADAQKARSII